jgi:hypothetical protein
VPIITPSGNGGFSSATATFTTGADTFVGKHVFDLGGPSVVTCTYTVTAQVADGETFGEGDGEISGTCFFLASFDGIAGAAFGLPGFTGPVAPPPQLVAVSDEQTACVWTPRYLICEVDLDEAPDFNIYAGPNHPTMTIRADITYR